jgi:hypothetical protein
MLTPEAADVFGTLHPAGFWRQESYWFFSDEQLSGRFMYRDLKLGLFPVLKSDFRISQNAYTYRETAIS